jgi:hypothetical protein
VPVAANKTSKKKLAKKAKVEQSKTEEKLVDIVSLSNSVNFGNN